MVVELDPARLTAAVEHAYEVSLEAARDDAEASAPTPKAGVELQDNTLVATGLGPVFEHGRRGGYDIAPRDKLALRFPDGSFATMVRGGAMSPEPYIGPAAERWATGGFQAVARDELGSQGF